MACRDIGRCQAARKQIVLKTHNRHVVCRDLDLSSYKSIVEFAARITKEEKHLDGLVNNAGVQTGIYERELTREGIEANLGINHFGHFLLTLLLLEKLKSNAKEARIVNVSSEVHYKGNFNFDDLNMDENYAGRSAYDRSKLAQVLFTKELAK